MPTQQGLGDWMRVRARCGLAGRLLLAALCCPSGACPAVNLLPATPASLSDGGGKVWEVAFSPDGTLMAAAVTSGNAPVVIRATNDWSVQQTLTPNLRNGASYAVRFSPAGTQLAVGGAGTDGSRPALFVYNTSDWSLLYSKEGEDAFINGLSYNHDGSLLATGGGDSAVSIYGTGGTLVQRLQDHSGLCGETAFNHDGTLLATAGRSDGKVFVYNTSDWTTPVQTLTFGVSSVMTVKFSPDGSFLAAASSSSGSSVVVWRVQNWTVFLDSGSLTTGRFWDVDFSPDGQWLASAGSKAHLWNMGDGSLAGTISGSASDATFSPNSSLLFVGGQTSTRIYDVACITSTLTATATVTSTLTATATVTSTLTATATVTTTATTATLTATTATTTSTPTVAGTASGTSGVPVPLVVGVLVGGIVLVAGVVGAACFWMRRPSTARTSQRELTAGDIDNAGNGVVAV